MDFQSLSVAKQRSTEERFFVKMVANQVANSYEISNEDKTPNSSKRESNNSKNREFHKSHSATSDYDESWTGGDLNPRPPPCQDGALPAELPALIGKVLLLLIKLLSTKIIKKDYLTTTGICGSP